MPANPVKRRHVDAWDFHASVSAFRGRHHGCESVEIPLHRHIDDRVRVGKIGDRHIVTLIGAFSTGFAYHVVPQEGRSVEFVGIEPSVVDVIGEIVGILPAIEAALSRIHCMPFHCASR